MNIKFNNPIVLYNPKAGGGKTKKKYQNVIELLRQSGLFETVDIGETFKEKEKNYELIKKIHADAKNDLIITIGGDGTISAIVNAVMQLERNERLPIFPLPSGSGDSLLRDFGIYSTKTAIENYKNLTSTKRFDLLLVENPQTGYKYYCINVLGLGFISDAVIEVLKFNKKFGAFSYILGVFSALKRFRAYDLTLKYIDENKLPQVYRTRKAYFMTVSNTKFSGGGIKVAPDAKFDDGKMDIIILHDINKLQFLKGFMRAFKGNHITAKGCQYIKTNYAEIYAAPQFNLMPDGELEENTPVKVTVISNEIELVV